MINPATSWFKIVELPTVTKLTVPNMGKGKKATCTNYTKVAKTFCKTSACWFSIYLHCQYLIHDDGSEFKLHFRALCATYGVKRTPTSIKNPTANAILEHNHAVFTNMLQTAKLNMAKLVTASDIEIFLSDAAWAICSTRHNHTVLKASPGAAIFG